MINDNAVGSVIIFNIFILILFEIYILVGEISDVFVALVPLIFINFSISIFEVLADKNEMKNYEKDKKHITIFVSFLATAFVILNLFVDTINKINNYFFSSLEIPLEISLVISLVIIILVAVVVIIMFKKVESYVRAHEYLESVSSFNTESSDEFILASPKEIEDEWDTQLILDNDDVLYININRKKYKDTNESN